MQIGTIIKQTNKHFSNVNVFIFLFWAGLILLTWDNLNPNMEM